MALWPFGKKSEEKPAKETPQETPPDAPQDEALQEKKTSRFSLFKRGLKKTTSGLRQIFGLKKKIDKALLDDLEVTLYEADFGPDLVTELLEALHAAWKEDAIRESQDIPGFMKAHLLKQLTARDTGLHTAPQGPTVYLVAGVNGTGKTTSIAKLAYLLKSQGHSVLLAAADTFRAGATEQLNTWSERIGVPIVLGSAEKKDPAAIAYTACEKAMTEGIDYLIVDTAGRLHTQVNLMRELEKVRRVIAKKMEGAPHETLLVLDATCGQNAKTQAEAFNAAIQLTGLIMSKLDGTAKGGIVVAINNMLQIPVKFVGLGEQATDLAEFDAEKFVTALFS